MRISSLKGVVIIWVLMCAIGICGSKRSHKMLRDQSPDIVAADEEETRYPGLDLEDTCKKAKNPKCEAVIDSFCIKSCNPYLCGEHGSIRGMCRLMCEAEDLPSQCTNMGPLKFEPLPTFDAFQQPGFYQPMVPFVNGFSQ
jgi:hypothetical protein